MRIQSTLHNHSTLSDGRNSPGEMAEAALRAGFAGFGLSDHGYVAFDPEYSIPSEAEYLRAARALRAEYDGRLKVYVGLEQDFLGPTRLRADYDYIIGSVHYLPEDGKYWSVDGPVEPFEQCLREAFGGDIRRMVERYYALVAENAEAYRPEVIGHFDLIAKNNIGGRFFSGEESWYMDAAVSAMERCHKTGAVFEFNTGGFRKERALPYPSSPLLGHMRAIGARLMLNADAHSADMLTYRFDEALALIRGAGYARLCAWTGGGFEEISI